MYGFELIGVVSSLDCLNIEIEWNKAYKSRAWIKYPERPIDSKVIILNPISRNGEERLHETLRHFYDRFAGQPTLYIIDDCSATKSLTKKKDMLSELAFSGRHAEQSVWVLTQKYNSVLKDLREQTKWICIFYTKDRDSFENCLRENDVIPSLEERKRCQELLSKTKHSKLVLSTEQPTGYWFIDLKSIGHV